MVGTPPKTAQSPRAISTLLRSRNILATLSVVELLTPPSRIPTVTPSLAGCLRSVTGVEVSVTSWTRSTMRSSISNNDIWQPAHPASQSLCLLYTSDAADDLLCVDLGGRRIIKKK